MTFYVVTGDSLHKRNESYRLEFTIRIGLILYSKKKTSIYTSSIPTHIGREKRKRKTEKSNTKYTRISVNTNRHDAAVHLLCLLCNPSTGENTRTSMVFMDEAEESKNERPK